MKWQGPGISALSKLNSAGMPPPWAWTCTYSQMNDRWKFQWADLQSSAFFNIIRIWVWSAETTHSEILSEELSTPKNDNDQNEDHPIPLIFMLVQVHFGKFKWLLRTVEPPTKWTVLAHLDYLAEIWNGLLAIRQSHQLDLKDWSSQIVKQSILVWTISESHKRNIELKLL